jgi:hypothetical protein
MTKTLMTLAAAATVAVVAVAAPTDAQARRGWWGPGAVIGGLAAGALIAGAAGAYGPYYGYGPGYGYYGGPAYAYGPGCHIRRERVWDGWGYRWRRVRVCY